MSSREAEGDVVLDADVFISYVKEDEMVEFSQTVIDAVRSGRLRGYVSSMLYDDIITGLRSKGMDIEDVKKVILAIASIDHISLPVTPAIALDALTLYETHGEPRRLHYFDAFHIATAHMNLIPIITSDQYIIEHQNELGVKAIDLRTM